MNKLKISKKMNMMKSFYDIFYLVFSADRYKKIQIRSDSIITKVTSHFPLVHTELLFQESEYFKDEF